MATPFRVVTAGTKVILDKDFQKAFGFSSGEILGLCDNCSVETAISDGGSYRVRPLDQKREIDHDRIYDCHRTIFVPVSNSKFAVARRRKKSAIAQ